MSDKNPDLIVFFGHNYPPHNFKYTVNLNLMV